MDGGKIRLYNPAYKPKPDFSTFLQPKCIPDLRGKSIVILDNSWWIWEQTLSILSDALLKRYGAAKVFIHKVPRSSPAPTDELKKIAGEVDCAILNLAFGAPEIMCIVENAVILMKEGLPLVCIVVGQDPDFLIWKKLLLAKRANIPFVTIPREPESLSVEEASEMMRTIIDKIVATLKEPGMLYVKETFLESIIELPESSLDEIYNFMYKQGWTDGLPVIPPTEDRVQKMLAFIHEGDPEKEIGIIPPLGGIATLGAIAANAVMAGCLPEHMPIIIAMVKSCRNIGYHAIGPLMTVINGPIRRKIDVNYSTGCLGPGKRSNATLGRALQLITCNIGETRLFLMPDMTGHPASYTFCFGENEEENPWEPLHVERGFARDISTVTVAGVYPASIIQCATYTYDWDTLLTVLANSIIYYGNSGMLYGSGRDGRGRVWVLLTPELAKRFAAAGLSKRDVKEYIWEKARFPVSQYPQKFVPYPHHLLVKDGEVYVIRDPDDVMILVVASQPGRYYAMTITGDAGETVPIDQYL